MALTSEPAKFETPTTFVAQLTSASVQFLFTASLLLRKSWSFSAANARH